MAVANIIMTSGFNNLISYLMKGNPTSYYFALGLGSPSWDYLENLPEFDESTSELVNEVYRQKIEFSDINYITPTEVVSNVPTNRIRINITVPPNNYYGITREYGIYAIDPTDELGSGTLILYCNHKSMSISGDVSYEKYVYINL